MNVDLIHEIHDRLVGYLARETRLEEFQRWFIPSTWDAQPHAGEARALVDSIELHLAEFTNGHLTEDELREQLADISRRRLIHVPPPRFETHATSTWEVCVRDVPSLSSLPHSG